MSSGGHSIVLGLKEAVMSKFMLILGGADLDKLWPRRHRRLSSRCHRNERCCSRNGLTVMVADDIDHARDEMAPRLAVRGVPCLLLRQRLCLGGRRALRISRRSVRFHRYQE